MSISASDSRRAEIYFLSESAYNLGIEVEEDQLELFLALADLVNEWSYKYNITAIRSRREILTKHIIDSLSVAIGHWQINDGKVPANLLDVGSGAGFPSLPIAIAFPDINVTALEAIRKKASFIAAASESLGLNVTVLNQRAEVAAHLPDLREAFELVVARAVAYMPTLLEYCLPFVRLGGRFVAMKSENLDEELNDSSQALEILGGEWGQTLHYRLPDVDGIRSLVVVNKVRSTPQRYPRRPGIPAKRPLK
ncbi:methyltransferase GidB [Thermobaculum terrenum ATCC BAA-798]|uniref:Ribosomal RNA small subunit methyltransferase G n=1 Tax=Thermobaculum terrenum (strain ATCC BAA-798 / CCMEE 7001 / YNP1) TaxID=525904 RepID=D1CD92_THET1|nr:16S rRNA (guanine(527)-N(7))-methyltransferase RsmG [Thermobaculum terrenum]ACZ42757.1 methyltransferase GidB [Thermobaculum terrenum ATCC BAA-798]